MKGFTSLCIPTVKLDKNINELIIFDICTYIYHEDLRTLQPYCTKKSPVFLVSPKNLHAFIFALKKRMPPIPPVQ